MDSVPTLPSLTPDDRIWRLDWFGETAYRTSLRRYKQPCVKVGLSALICEPGNSGALLEPDSTDHQNPHELWIPISTLPLLGVGDLWQHGRQIASPGYQMEYFKQLVIDQNTASFVKAGLAIDEHFLLPLSHHPWHRPYTQSYCVSVIVKENVRLIVPCMELIRFYFGSSGNLLKRLFTNPLNANSLWVHREFNRKNRHLHLVLAERLSGVSASDIGRIAASKLAWRSAAGIYSSSQKASIQGLPVYPYTGFPFEGHTDLIVHGKWLPFGENEEKTFLAYRIRSCSHPFPFRSLSYEAADRKVLHPASSEGSQNPTSSAVQGKSSKAEIVNRDPGNRKKPRKKTFKTKIKFPDLAHKKVWRDKVETMSQVDVFIKHADGGLEQVAYGEPEGDGDAGVAGIDVTQTSDEAISSLPKFAQQGLKSLRTTRKLAPEGATIKLICPKEKNSIIFSLPIVADENGEFDDSVLFTQRNGHTRQRMACLTEIFLPPVTLIHVFIVEGRKQFDLPSLIPSYSMNVTDILPEL